LYGGHPYARDVSGEPADVDVIDANDLKRTWKAFAQPDEAFLIVVGDVTPGEVVTQTKKVFGAWRAQAPKPHIDLATPENPETNHIYVVDRPGAAQSEIRIAQLGVTHTCPQIAESDLVEAYFGGTFGSRLNNAIRVQKGLTYGARGYFNARRFLGSFTISTFTKTDRTAEAVRLALAEIGRLREESPTAEELTRQQRYFLGSVPARYETPQQVAGMLAHIVLNDLPDDHFRRRYARIGALDAEGCMQFIRQTVHPDRMVIVVVGDSARIAEPLKSIAPVTVVKPEARS
jgi:zinc protease